jgi:hypothetical protein
MSDTPALEELLYSEIPQHAVMRAHGTLLLACKAELTQLRSDLAEAIKLFKSHHVSWADCDAFLERMKEGK